MCVMAGKKSWKWAKQKHIQYEVHLKMAGFLLNFGNGSKRLFFGTFWDINSRLPIFVGQSKELCSLLRLIFQVGTVDSFCHAHGNYHCKGF